jgi:hypothetical protein
MKGSNREIWRCFLQKVKIKSKFEKQNRQQNKFSQKNKKSIRLAILKKSANYLQRRKKTLERSEGNYLGLCE